MNIFDISGKTALVTGAGTGIGQQIAISLAEAGARVIVAARRLDKLEETVKRIEQAGGEAFAIAVDVTDSKSIAECFKQVEASSGLLILS